MASADIRISLSGGDVMGGNLMRFEPGSTMQCNVQLLPQDNIRCKRVIAQIGWHTEGRGDRDNAIVLEVPITQETNLEAGRQISNQFNLVLPKEPWSYAGYYINIIWQLKVIIDIQFSTDINAAQPFVLAPRL